MTGLGTWAAATWQSPRISSDPVEQETDFALSQDALRKKGDTVLVVVLAAVLLMPGTRENVYNFHFYNFCSPVSSVRLQPPLAAIKFLTSFWALFAIIGFLAAIPFKERALIRCCVILTAVCCWLLWLVTFLMQLNPLIGPRVNQRVIYGMMSYWENSYMQDE
ncbi:hypothetical protein ACLKA7_008003 [Drosophila subpalustris]